MAMSSIPVLAGITSTVIFAASMPAGPIWLLHGFYLVTSALMLIWSVRYTEVRALESAGGEHRP